MLEIPLQETRGGRVVGERCEACWSQVGIFFDYDNRLCAWCACEFPDDQDEMLIDDDDPDENTDEEEGDK